MSQVAASSVLELARRTCDFIPSDTEYEGEFHPDPDVVEAWRQEPDQNYDGRWKYVNLGPEEVRRRIEADHPDEEHFALKVAYDFWCANDGYSSAIEAGTVDRGEPREARVANSMMELTGGERVSHVMTLGAISAEPTGVSRDGKFLGLDVIDYGFLLGAAQEEGIPQNDDWF